jgi:hypothetical protein
MIRVADLIIEVAQLLNDAEAGYEHTRWPKEELLEYGVDAITQIAMLRPESVAKTETVALQPGTKQALPDGAIRFYRIEGTLDKDGRLIGQPIAKDVVAARLAASWFNQLDCVSTYHDDYVVSSFYFEEANPKTFYVSPPVPVGKFISIAVNCALVPETLELEAALPLGRQFHNAMIEWMLYRAFSKDQESATDSGHAQMHLKHFYDILGLSKQADKEYYAKAAVVP